MITAAVQQMELAARLCRRSAGDALACCTKPCSRVYAACFVGPNPTQRNPNLTPMLFCSPAPLQGAVLTSTTWICPNLPSNKIANVGHGVAGIYHRQVDCPGCPQAHVSCSWNDTCARSSSSSSSSSSGRSGVVKQQQLVIFFWWQQQQQQR